ncbi:hypothetical protein H9N28_11795 [Rhodobacter capsulatus]|uniref:hypothetical protein n=1 Tax=Rhodobacter capsulatus TaxID=1061 RepID=UPI0006DBEFF5|nr:hypothetical protein [Rhodobacter capsulatus]KQB11864.1 hypothetical protein AP073_07770 [Rhodobacter capsulatus]KQB11981.1 hypothetical protein AP071_08500 [Rhodobacter capsulatus]PZX23800.1 hypothetical protein LY44_02430 [Rhodobacter capsulatus]QNR62257.1 hypothetical protein H9N28_11795 [Rhodobacter capsulatus]
MSELNEKQLAALARERAKIFTPGWFADLVSARLGFGDTFWLGLFGVLLFVVPAVVLIGGLLYAQAPGALMPFFRITAGLYGLWTLGVLQALLRIGARGGYPMAGLVVTAGIALSGLYTAVTL